MQAVLQVSVGVCYRMCSFSYSLTYLSVSSFSPAASLCSLCNGLSSSLTSYIIYFLSLSQSSEVVLHVQNGCYVAKPGYLKLLPLLWSSRDHRFIKTYCTSMTRPNTELSRSTLNICFSFQNITHLFSWRSLKKLAGWFSYDKSQTGRTRGEGYSTKGFRVYKSAEVQHWALIKNKTNAIIFISYFWPLEGIITPIMSHNCETSWFSYKRNSPCRLC